MSASAFGLSNTKWRGDGYRREQTIGTGQAHGVWLDPRIGSVCAILFIRWSEWTLTMTLSCWQHIGLSTIPGIIIRPPDILVGGLRFYRDSIFFLSFPPLPSELPERNSTKTGHMLGSEYDLKMHVRNLGCTLSLQIGVQTSTFFRRLHNLTPTLTSYIFGTI